MSKIRILVVEDESLVARDIQNMLRSLGYDVTGVVSSGEQAIQKAAASVPDLVLMDIVLKGEIDGIAAAERIWEDYGIPVIYLTAYADDTTFEQGQDDQAVRLPPQALRRAGAADDDRNGPLQVQDGEAAPGARAVAVDGPAEHRGRGHRRRRRGPDRPS